MSDSPATATIRKVAREVVHYGWALLPRRRPRQKFVLLLHGRSGSQLLADMINGHPDAHCDGELLSPNYVRPLAAPGWYLRGRAARRPVSVYGFRLKWAHLEEHQALPPAPFLLRLVDRGWKVIYSQRRNPVRQAISYRIAAQRGRFHDTKPPAARRKYRIEIGKLMELLQRNAVWRCKMDAFVRDIPHLSIVYERDLADPDCHQATLDRTLRFLGLPPVPARTRLVKTGSRRLQDDVANYDEIAAALRGTRYEPYLAEAA